MPLARLLTSPKDKNISYLPHSDTVPDGLRVYVNRCDSLQQEFHHLQERICGLLGERQLSCDFPLEKNIHK